MRATNGMIGRGAELDILEGLLEGARAGRGSAALIEGEAGIGKTTLVRELGARASADGFEVLTAGADELSAIMPFAPLLEALDCRFDAADPERAAVARALTEAPAEMTIGRGGSPLVGRVIEGFLRILEGLALDGPTLLVVEDLHWADRPTLVAVRTIARRLSDVPLVMVATMRPAATKEMEQLLDAVERIGATHMRVEALTVGDVRALARAIAGGKPGIRLITKLDGAGGNPLYVRELLNGLLADEAITVEDGVAEIGDAGLPPTLRQMLLRGLGDLPEGSLDVLRMASLLGTTFSLGDLATIMARDARELERPLRAPLDAGALIPRGERYAFRHDLLRDAVYEDIPDAVRRSLHKDAAQALEDAGAPLTQVTQHLVRGASAGDPGGLRRLREPLLEIGKTDSMAAVELAEIAFNLLPPDDPDRDYIPAEAAELAAAGKLDEAEAILRRKLSRPRWPPVEGRLRAILAHTLYLAGRREEALDELSRALAIPELKGFERTSLYWTAIQWLLFGGDQEGAVELAQRGLASAEREGNREGVVANLILLSLASLWGGKLRDAERCAERAVAMRSKLYQPSALRQVCFALPEVDRNEDAERAIRSMLADDPDDRVIQSLGAWMLMNAGRWDEALVELETAAEGASGEGLAYVWGAMAMMLVGLGRLDEAAIWVKRGEDLRAAKGTDLGLDAVVTALALLQDARGDDTGACKTLAEAWDGLRPNRSPAVFRRLGPEAVRIAMAVGERDFARHATEDAEDWAGRTGGVVSAEALATRCRGLLEHDAETLLRAIELFRETPHRLFERMQCTEDAAAALARAGRTDEARTLFDEAIDAYDEMGAVYYAQRATAAMRGFGMRRGARGKRGRPTAGWESLTPTELQIVELVADGMRNAEVAERLFIAPSTVSTHLRHVFQKLSLSSRVELTKEFAARRTAGAH